MGPAGAGTGRQRFMIKWNLPREAGHRRPTRGTQAKRKREKGGYEPKEVELRQARGRGKRVVLAGRRVEGWEGGSEV